LASDLFVSTMRHFLCLARGEFIILIASTNIVLGDLFLDCEDHCWRCLIFYRCGRL